MAPGATKRHRSALSSRHVSSGICSLDQVLGGRHPGLAPGTITEIISEGRFSRTQVCHAFAVAAVGGLPCQAEAAGAQGASPFHSPEPSVEAVPSQGLVPRHCGKVRRAASGAVNCEEPTRTAKVVYMDTSNSFRPQRIHGIAEHLGLDPEAVADNIIYVRVHSSAHLLLLLEDPQGMLSQALAAVDDGDLVSLVVLDSVSGLLSQAAVGEAYTVDGSRNLARAMELLESMSQELYCAVLLANQVFIDLDEGECRPVAEHIVRPHVEARVIICSVNEDEGAVPMKHVARRWISGGGDFQAGPRGASRPAKSSATFEIFSGGLRDLELAPSP